jgi:hypothetical protein
MRNIFLTFWQVASSLTSLKTSPEFDVVLTLKRRRCCSQTRGREDCPELKTMTTILNPGDKSFFKKSQKMKFYPFETKNNNFLIGIDKCMVFRTSHGRYDSQHNDIQHNDTQHKVIYVTLGISDNQQK